VLLGLPYTQAIDMWSFGCILVEMLTGKPFFPAVDERELMEIIYVRLGMPSDDMIQKGKKKNMLFDGNLKIIRST